MAMVDFSTNSMYYYLNDRLGTPLIMTDDTGTVVWEAYYKPFGEATINPNSTVVNNIRLPGQYFDNETSLHYNYHRYYDPRTGRYLTPDPIGLEGGINLYWYVENSPTALTDVYGLKPIFELKYREGLLLGIKLGIFDIGANFSSSVHNLITGEKTVEQSFRVGLSLGKSVLFGIGAEREECGEPRPPLFDEWGAVIPGSGLSVPQILSLKPWKWSGFPGSGNFGIGKDDIKLRFGGDLLFIGIELTINISEIADKGAKRITQLIWENWRAK